MQSKYTYFFLNFTPNLICGRVSRESVVLRHLQLHVVVPLRHDWSRLILYNRIIQTGNLIFFHDYSLSHVIFLQAYTNKKFYFVQQNLQNQLLFAYDSGAIINQQTRKYYPHFNVKISIHSVVRKFSGSKYYRKTCMMDST